MSTCKRKLVRLRSLVGEEATAVPNYLSGSMFYLWLMSVDLISSLEQGDNFENVSRILDCGARYLMPWFPNMGKVFLYKPLTNKMGLVSDLFSRQMFNVYIVRSLSIRRVDPHLPKKKVLFKLVLTL